MARPKKNAKRIVSRAAVAGVAMTCALVVKAATTTDRKERLTYVIRAPATVDMKRRLTYVRRN